MGLPVALRGALWMGGAVVSFSMMAIAVRELLRTLGVFEILFLRSLVSLALLAAVLPVTGWQALRTRRFGLHVVRNLFHFGGQYAWVYAIAGLPLATVFAIEFTMPVWAALLAIPILGERLNRGRVIMLILGLAGVLIIAYAATMIGTKRLAQSDTAMAVLFYMSAIQAPFGLIPALPGWVTPGLAELPWIVAVGATGLTAHFCLTRSLRIADATLVVPIDFLRLPLIAAVGAALYAEPLELSILLGAAVIFTGTYTSIRLESR
jgi:drug/metabolite transporter (DMT)-like permease